MHYRVDWSCVCLVSLANNLKKENRELQRRIEEMELELASKLSLKEDNQDKEMSAHAADRCDADSPEIQVRTTFRILCLIFFAFRTSNVCMLMVMTVLRMF